MVTDVEGRFGQGSDVEGRFGQGQAFAVAKSIPESIARIIRAIGKFFKFMLISSFYLC
jgi:hypothetical protein